MDDRSEHDSAAASQPRVAQAAITLEGRAIRYADVEKRGVEPLKLRRLGTADFDFDVAEAVLGSTAPSNLDVVLEAVSQILRDTPAKTLKVLVHPDSLVGFFTPLPEHMSAVERHEQLRQEAALLADVTPADPVRIRAVPLRSEEVESIDGVVAHRWHHVYHLPEAVHARLTLIARALNVGTYDIVDSTRAAIQVVRALDRIGATNDAPPNKPISLVLGWYASDVELGLMVDGEWHYSHHASVGSPDDAAYFASALLERLSLPVSDVGRLLLYGEGIDLEEFALLADLTNTRPELLNPLEIFGRNPSGATKELLASYVTSIGSVL